jgi:comEA protein
MKKGISKGFVYSVCLIAALVGLAFVALPALAETAAPDKDPAGITGQLNINTANEKELSMLPGIGKKTAANIISYRQENGMFKAVDELQKVNGVGKKTLEKFRGNCSVEGESTLVRVKK